MKSVDEPMSDRVAATPVASTGLVGVEALRLRAAGSKRIADQVIVEVPVAMLYNGVPHAVMLATPCDLDDFALGFALTEGIVRSPDEFELVDVLHAADGISLQALIPAIRFEALRTRTRNLTGRSGCGLCGTATLEEASRPAPRVGVGPVLSREVITGVLSRLGSSQPLNARSGGVHAAAFASPDSPELVVREDVGRHNALDKLIGALAASGDLHARCSRGLLAITSRASHEIVHKAAHAGITVVAAISAPTSLAIATAEAAGITLIGFARGEAMNVYSHPHRVG